LKVIIVKIIENKTKMKPPEKDIIKIQELDFKKINNAYMSFNNGVQSTAKDYLREYVEERLENKIIIDDVDTESWVIYPKEESELFGRSNQHIGLVGFDCYQYPCLATSEKNFFVFEGFHAGYGLLNPKTWCFNIEENPDHLEKITNTRKPKEYLDNIRNGKISKERERVYNLIRKSYGKNPSLIEEKMPEFFRALIKGNMGGTHIKLDLEEKIAVEVDDGYSTPIAINEKVNGLMVVGHSISVDIAAMRGEYINDRLIDLRENIPEKIFEEDNSFLAQDYRPSPENITITNIDEKGFDVNLIFKYGNRTERFNLPKAK